MKKPETLVKIVPRKRWILLGFMLLTFFFTCFMLDGAFGWEIIYNGTDSEAWASNCLSGCNLTDNSHLNNTDGLWGKDASPVQFILRDTAGTEFAVAEWTVRLGTSDYIVPSNLTIEIQSYESANVKLWISPDNLTWYEMITNSTYPPVWRNIVAESNLTQDNLMDFINASDWFKIFLRPNQTTYSNSLLFRGFNLTGDVLENYLVIHAYYESNRTEIPFDVSLSNGTQTDTFNDVFPFEGSVGDVPLGNVDIQASDSPTFPTRHYYITVYPQFKIEFDVYLLELTEGAYVRFHVQDQAGDPLPSALVTAQKQYGTEWITVNQGQTDDSGTATLFLNPTDTYKILVSYAGYVGQELTITPSSPDYTITMVSSTDLRYHNLFDDISYQLVPLTLAVDSTDWINYSVYSYNGSLEYWGLNLTYQNGTCVNCQISATAGGGELDGNFSLSGVDRIVAYYYFKRAGYSEWYQTRTYLVHNITSGQFSIFNIFNTNMSDPDFIPPFVRDMSILAVITVVSIPFGAISPMGAGFLALLGLGFTTVVGWFSANLFILIVLALGSMVVVAGLGK